MRYANFEIMRIILCFLIILHHHEHHVKYFARLDPFYKLLVTILFIPAVNCFVFITGYFGKSPKWRPSRILVLLFKIAITNIFASMYIAHSKKQKIQFANHLTYKILFFRNWFHHCYIFIYLIQPVMRMVGSFFNERIAYLISTTLVYYIFTFEGYDGSFPVSNGYTIVWFFFLYVHGYCLRDHFNLNFRYKLVVYILIYIVIMKLSWNLQFVNQKLHPTINYYWPKFFKKCVIPVNYANWPSFLISIAFFKVFQNIEINNEYLQKIIVFFSKYIDILFMLHHYPGLMNIIAKTEYYDISKFSLFKQLLFKSLNNFLFCFCYSFVFHLIFDPILSSSFVTSALNKFDDLINNFYHTHNIDENIPEFNVLKEDKYIIKNNSRLIDRSDGEKLINDNCIFEKFDEENENSINDNDILKDNENKYYINDNFEKST